MEVDVFYLREPSSNESGLEFVDSPIAIVFDLENPFAGDFVVGLQTPQLRVGVAQETKLPVF